MLLVRRWAYAELRKDPPFPNLPTDPSAKGRSENSSDNQEEARANGSVTPQVDLSRADEPSLSPSRSRKDDGVGVPQRSGLLPSDTPSQQSEAKESHTEREKSKASANGSVNQDEGPEASASAETGAAQDIEEAPQIEIEIAADKAQ